MLDAALITTTERQFNELIEGLVRMARRGNVERARYLLDIFNESLRIAAQSIPNSGPPVIIEVDEINEEETILAIKRMFS